MAENFRPPEPLGAEGMAIRGRGDISKSVDIKVAANILGSFGNIDPEKVAIVSSSGSLTYAMLNTQADHLTLYLSNAGIGQESKVGVYLERCPNLIVALVAILRAGAAFVPLDPAHPVKRTEFILADAGLSLVVTSDTLKNKLPDVTPTISFEQLQSNTDEINTQTNPFPLRAERGAEQTQRDLAYLIYTSGSTGTPKGVLVERYSLWNYVAAAIQNFGLTEEDRVLQFASVSFDTALEEVFPILSVGGTLVLRNDLMLSSSETFLQSCQVLRVTILDLPTSYWHQLVADVVKHQIDVSFLTGVIIGGEKAEEASVVAWNQYLRSNKWNMPLWNTYGPTEATIVATQCDVSGIVQQQNAPVPIGTAISNAWTIILDNQQRPTTAGQIGTLYVGGAGVARGYVNRPDLEQETFIANPYLDSPVAQQYPGSRIYNTGDLVRENDEGLLEYMGRADNQLKIAGYRVELAEIETVLAGHPDVSQAVVKLDDNPNNHDKLIGFIVKTQTRAPTERELAEYLRDYLPHYMIPRRIVFLTNFPLTSNGKVDRDALVVTLSPTQMPLGAAPSNNKALNPTQRRIADIWREALQEDLRSISMSDDFFALGGSSLTAIKALALIDTRFDVQLTLLQFQDNSTLAEMARQIETTNQTTTEKQLIPRLPGDADAPLSLQQEGLWVFEGLEPNTSAHTVIQGFQLTGMLDIEALKASLNVLVDRHGALRTSYRLQDDIPIQVDDPHSTALFEFTDIEELAVQTGKIKSQLLEDHQRAAVNKPFEFPAGPFFRTHLYKLSTNEHFLILLVHHSIFDGWSLDILLHEFSALYNAQYYHEAPKLPEVSLAYADFANWQRMQLDSELWKTELAYWRSQLSGRRSAVQLPTDYPRKRRTGSRGGTRQLELSTQLVTNIRQASSTANVSTFVFCLSAFNALLYRYTGESDVVVGTLSANREYASLQSMIGYVANTLAIRQAINPTTEFSEHLRATQKIWRSALANKNVPFGHVIKKLRGSLADDADLVEIFLIHYQLDDRDLNLAGIHSRRYELFTQNTHGDLLLWLDETQSNILLVAEYNTALFTPETIDRLLAHYQQLLVTVSANTQIPFSTIDILTKSEHQQRFAWNNTALPTPKYDTIVSLLAEQVNTSPDRIAVTGPDATLTYFELEQRVNLLANMLIKRNITNTVVAVGLCRSSHLLVAILAIFKAGAAYLPVDNQMPTDRITLMLEEARVTLVLTDIKNQVKLTAQSASLLLIDRDVPWQEAPLAPAVSVVQNPLDTAYIIYTSGSTGRPKGVVVQHRALTNLLASMAVRPGIAPTDRFLALTALTFDIAILELLLPLSVGAQLIIAADETIGDPLLLSQLCDSQQATIMQATPVMWNLMVENGWHRQSLRAWCGGEAMPISVAKTLHANFAETWNMYGPTETTVWSTCHLLTKPDEHNLIGTPIHNTQIFILDEFKNPTPVGITGEIYIAGNGLAKGYKQSNLQNDSRFIELFTDLNSPTPAFRTGDLGKYHPNGTIEFLGRADTQIKLRGFRIELGEIEATINQLDNIREVAVVTYPPGSPDRQIVAYVVIQGESYDTQTLSRELTKTLPRHMLPKQYIVLDKLPVTSNGKIDRQALPNPVVASATRIRQPHSAVGKYLTLQWATILGIPSTAIGLDDNFFDLGGNSLLAIRIVMRLRRELKLEMSLRLVYEANTLEELIEQVEAIYRSQHSDAPQRSFVVPLQPEQEGVPLFCICGIDLYRHLAKRLNHNGPIYAVFVHGDIDELIADPEAALGKFPAVEELARRYVTTILDYIPVQKYHLIGVSFGGILAYEIAHQLKAKGIDVGLLALLDTLHPHSGARRRPLAWLSQYVWHGALNALESFTNQASHLGTMYRNWLRRDGADPNSPLEGGDWDVEEADDLRSEAYMAAQSAYHVMPYNGDVVLVKATQSHGGRAYRLLDDYGWSEEVKGKLTIEKVEGDHLGILKSPAVETLAKLLDPHSTTELSLPSDKITRKLIQGNDDRIASSGKVLQGNFTDYKSDRHEP